MKAKQVTGTMNDATADKLQKYYGKAIRANSHEGSLPGSVLPAQYEEEDEHPLPPSSPHTYNTHSTPTV